MRIARALCLPLLLVGCQGGTPSTLNTTDIGNALDAATATFGSCIQTVQLSTCAAVLTEDHFNMPPNHPAIAGRAQWLAWAESLSVAGHMSSAPTPEWRHYGDSLTVERGRYVNTFVPAPNAPNPIPAVADTGKYVWLWRRTATGWQLAAAIWNSDALPKR